MNAFLVKYGDMDESHMRRGAEALEETIHNAQQAQGMCVWRTIFVPRLGLKGY